MTVLNVHLPLRTRLVNRKTGHQHRNYLSTIWEGFNGEGRSRKRVIGFDDLGSVYFRHAKYCDEADNVRIGHKGWYCDEFCDDLMRGVIAQLPARNGEEQWIAGYEESTGGMVVFFMDVHDSEASAAQMADEHARIVAENEQEYRAEESRKQRIEDLKAENKQARDDIKAMKRSLASLRETIKSNKKQIAELV